MAARLLNDPEVQGKFNCITSTPFSSLAELHQEWLDGPWPDQTGQRNADRKPDARANYLRALRALSYATGHQGDLATTPCAPLSLPAEAIGKLVERGLQLEAEGRGKPVPKVGLVRSMTSNARALARFAVENRREVFQSGRKLIDQRRGRTRRDPMAYQNWPAALRLQFEAYQEWLGRTALPPAERLYRPRKMAKATIVNQRNSLGQYVKWRVEQGLVCEALTDLVNEHEYDLFIEDYLRINDEVEQSLGGYTTAKQAAIFLAGMVRYLVATEQYDPFTELPTPETAFKSPLRSKSEANERLEACKVVRQSFYAVGRQVEQRGVLEEKQVHKSPSPNWTPQDLRDLRRVGFHSPARRAGRRGPYSAAPREQFTRKRSATIFGISSETPLRIRTLTVMLWKNMKRLPDGRWRIKVSGNQLKVRFLRGEINVYEHVYSREVSAYIDEYREVLAVYFGPKFEREVPNVFPIMVGTAEKPIGRPGTEQTIGAGMTQLAAELRGERFTPHDSRHIVATYCIRTYGAPGIMLAAKLLGDTPKMVLKHYVKELEDGAPELEAYFEGLKP